MTITEDRLDLAGDQALAQLVASTAITSAMPSAAAAATRAVLAQQVRAATSTPRAALGRGAPTARRRRVALIAAPALAAAVVGAVLVATAGPTAPAGVVAAPTRQIAWSPVAQLLPTPVQPALDADASQSWATACAGDYGNEAYVGPGAAAASARAVHHVLAERRGASTLCVDVVFGQGSAQQPSVALGGLTIPGGAGQYSWTSWQHQAISAPTGGDVIVLGGDSTTTTHRGSAATAMLYGAAGPQVSAVQVALGSGQRVTASVRDGIWAAWWPLGRGQAGGAELVVTTSAGQTTIDATTARTPDDDVPAKAPGAEARSTDPSAPEANQAADNYTNAITRRIVACLQDKGYPALLEGSESEMTDGAGRTQLFWSVKGFDSDNLTYRADSEACTTAAQQAVPSPPS